MAQALEAQLFSTDFPEPMIPFATACASGMVATACIQSIDTVKVRLPLTQHTIQRPSPLCIARNIVSQDGFIGLYHGLSAGFLRQLVYGTMRLGLFTTFEQAMDRGARTSGSMFDFKGRSLCGLSAGALAALVGNPTEVAQIRMQADGIKPVEKQANYRNAFLAIHRIASHEGIRVLWSGSEPTMVRAIFTNFRQLTFFSESKYQLEKHSPMSSNARTALAAAIGGFFRAFLGLPFDFIKTRLQNQVRTTTNSSTMHLYLGTFDCFFLTIKQEGVLDSTGTSCHIS